MSKQKQPREHYIPIWGIFLLFLGIVFLLQSLNVLPWGLWGTLWRFWPVLIIITGLGILLRRGSVWLMSVLILALLFSCLGIAIWQYRAPPPVGQTTQSYSEALGSLERAQIAIDFTVGSLAVNSLSPGSLNFVEVDSKMRNGDTSMRADFRRQDNEGRLHLSRERVNPALWDEGRDKWQVSFSRNIPLTVDVKSSVSNLSLDLSELKITELQMDIDVGNCTIKMPSPTGTINAYIKANLANLEVIIPDGVAAKLKADVDLGTLWVDESRFLRKGDYYLSRDFESAKNRIELELDGALSRVQLK